MKKIITHTFQLLSPPEKKTFFLFIYAELIFILTDLAAIAGLVWLMGHYNTLLLHPYTTPLFNRPQYLLLSFLVFFAIKNSAAVWNQKKQFQFYYRIATRLSGQNMLHYLGENYLDFTNNDSSVYIRQIMQLPVEFAQYILVGLQQLITQSILVIIAIGGLFIFNAQLFLYLLVLLAVGAGFVLLNTRKKIKRIRSRTKQNNELALQYAKEAIASFTECKIYNQEGFFTGRYHHWQEQLNNQLSGLQAVQAMPSRVMEIFAVSGLGFLLLIIPEGGGTGNSLLLTFGAFMAAAYRILPATVKIINGGTQVRAFEKTVNELIKIRPVSFQKNSSREKIHLISFEKISFSYTDKEMLKEVSFSLQPGDYIGLSGRSGKGKTTLLNILLGFIAPSKGRVLINGKPRALNDFRYDLAYVKQDPLIIHDSIKNNILFGDPDPNNEKLNKALEISGLKDFVDKQPLGLDTLITEAGKNISGGQRQRIAIARALYKDADVMILDEPFNELDNDSTENLLHHFGHLASQGKMVLLISHNRQGLAFCHKIISLDED